MIVSSLVSNHHLICLQVEKGNRKINYPFNFNSTWLKKDSYVKLVCNQWASPNCPLSTSPSSNLVYKFKRMAKLVSKWERGKEAKLKVYLIKMEMDIKNIYMGNSTSILSNEEKLKLWELEKKKIQILEKEESTWHLKSHALWLNKGDIHNKYFHNYVNHRWMINKFGNCRINKAILYQGITLLNRLGRLIFIMLFKI